jgi:Ca2+-binding EF-hand superfamily protein
LKRAKDSKKKIQEEKKTEGKKTESKEGNEDELIDLAEFRKLMEDTFKPLNITITQEMVEWNFNQIDKDGSGRISFEEFLAFIRKYNQ